MKSTVERLTKILTFAEIAAIKALIEELDGKDEFIIVVSKVTNKIDVTKSSLIQSLRLLEVAGVISSSSLGAKGTYIKVLDREALNDLIA